MGWRRGWGASERRCLLYLLHGDQRGPFGRRQCECFCSCGAACWRATTARRPLGRAVLRPGWAGAAPAAVFGRSMLPWRRQRSQAGRCPSMVRLVCAAGRCAWRVALRRWRGRLRQRAAGAAQGAHAAAAAAAVPPRCRSSLVLRLLLLVLRRRPASHPASSLFLLFFRACEAMCMLDAALDEAGPAVFGARVSLPRGLRAPGQPAAARHESPRRTPSFAESTPTRITSAGQQA